MRIIRLILGRLILLFNWVFTPRGVKRSADMQAIINGKTAKLALYQYEACPFCVKVRREMKRWVPVQAVLAVIGLGLWLTARFV